MSEKQYEDGEADERMTLEKNERPSRFRPRYRKLEDEELQRIDEIKGLAGGLEEAILHGYLMRAPSETRIALRSNYEEGRAVSREHALAITKLEEAVMWATKGLSG